jgi:hypothetical protein
MQTAIHKILYREGWNQEDAKIYCEQGGATQLVALTFDNFYSLLLHIIGKSYQHPEQWEHVGRQYLEFHAKHLRLIRKYALRRSQMIFQNCIYLQNAKESGYQSTKLLAKLTEELQKASFNKDSNSGPTKAGSPGKPKEWACSHCHGNFHTSGSEHCNLPAFKARDA